ncbi:hypothetical protein [Caldiplasma sukawensis]
MSAKDRSLKLINTEDAGDKKKLFSDMKKAAGISIIGLIFLWFIPVVGPFMTGYLSGRASGNIKNALILAAGFSFTMIVAFLMLTNMQLQTTSFLADYIRNGIVAFTKEPFVSSSNILFYTDTYYGFIISMMVILPSNLTTYFSSCFLGGAKSQLDRESSRKFENKVDLNSVINNRAAAPSKKGTRLQNTVPGVQTIGIYSGGQIYKEGNDEDIDELTD